MLWAIGIGGAFLYVIVLFTLGLATLRNGHGWMFFFRIFFPCSGSWARSCDRRVRGTLSPGWGRTHSDLCSLCVLLDPLAREGTAVAGR